MLNSNATTIEVENDKLYKLHVGALIQSCCMMCNLAAMLVDGFIAIHKKIYNIINMLKVNQGTSKDRHTKIFSKDGKVLDISIMQTKGWL